MSSRFYFAQKSKDYFRNLLKLKNEVSGQIMFNRENLVEIASARVGTPTSALDDYSHYQVAYHTHPCHGKRCKMAIFNPPSISDAKEYARSSLHAISMGKSPITQAEIIFSNKCVYVMYMKKNVSKAKAKALLQNMSSDIRRDLEYASLYTCGAHKAYIKYLSQKFSMKIVTFAWRNSISILVRPNDILDNLSRSSRKSIKYVSPNKVLLIKTSKTGRVKKTVFTVGKNGIYSK